MHIHACNNLLFDKEGAVRPPEFYHALHDPSRLDGTAATPPRRHAATIELCIYSARTTSLGSTPCFDVEMAEIHVRFKSLGSFSTASSAVGTF